MTIDIRQIKATIKRYDKRERIRNRNERLIREGRFLEADSAKRVEKFLNRRNIDFEQAIEAMRNPAAAENIIPTQEPTTPIDIETAGAPNPLERILGTNNLLGVAFLERGLQVSRSIGRVWVSVSNGRPNGYGTGFMISPHLLLTNHHVLETKTIAANSFVEFDYQIGLDGKFLPTTTFEFDPDSFYFTDEHLDYSVVAVRANNGSKNQLAHFGWNPLIEEEGKAIISQFLNIIQHPNGEPKQLAFRENQLIDVLDDFIQYKTDTSPGSSGSAVYNDRWEVVALHHSGKWATNAAGQILAVDGRIWDSSMGEHRIKWIANEGIRISRLIKHLRQQNMNQAQRKLFDETFTSPPALPFSSALVEKQQQSVSASNSANGSSASVAVTPDGTATWTIPLSVSVKLGDTGVSQVNPPADNYKNQPVSNADKTSSAPPTNTVAKQPDEILAAAKREIASRADVLNVRLGYVFKNGWITNERAVVVTVRQKLSNSALNESRISALPENFMGLPVEVVNPTIFELVTRARGATLAESVFAPSEILPQEITYTNLPGNLLKKITAPMRVIAHVSPDAGWTQLSQFLQGVNNRLVVGMFDFGAPHIADAVEDAGRGQNFRKMTLVIQPGASVGSGTKANDLTDKEVVEKLENALGNKFENAWVNIGRVNGWVASSYHIKVAVRDQKAFWLSSGNWQSSNQPKADPLSENPPQRKWLDDYNREWHAIVEHAGLAKIFERYLMHDFQNNLGAADGDDEMSNLPDILIPEEFFKPSPEERASQFRYFAPFDDTRNFTVTPILTPDNFHEEVLQLIKSAQSELLIQNQTFNAPKENHRKLRELIDAVIERREHGVDVKVIFRVLRSSDARANLEALKDYGFNTDIIRVQKNCHTKGVIVDRKRVLLGSQNWSNDGVSVNRDASLLFDDVPLANYFAEIFEHDWNNRAQNNIGSERMPVEWIGANEKTPGGMVRFNWKEYLEML